MRSEFWSFRRVVSILTVAIVAGCMSAKRTAIQTELPCPESIVSTMKKVADWQLEHPSSHKTTDWTHGALFAGMCQWAMMSDDDKYAAALQNWGRKNNWQPGERIYHADDHCVGQMYLELYSIYRKPEMMAGIRDRFDRILANPSDVTLQPGKQQGKDRWWWCDALFMAPPVWTRLAAITGQKKYIEFMDSQWQATTDYLYDKDEHLYFRDENYFDKREANGKKIFWSRGNGWVFAGLVRVLEYMPQDFAGREKYLTLYRQMAEKLVSIQGADGLWRSSLLDPVSYPSPEASGSGFYCYGLAWGINRGILDKKVYLPAVLRAWKGLTGCVHDDGMLGYVQPIGADPKKVGFDQTEIYGVGAFLLAGSEVYKIAVRGKGGAATVKASNGLTAFRDAETVSLKWDELKKKLSLPDAQRAAVFDFERNRFVVSQPVDNDGDGKIDELLFQSDFAPNQRKFYQVMPLPAGLQRPDSQNRTFGMFVPQRMDDFAWENDRIAFRMYGKALESELVSSGVDVWVKKVRYPVIEKWYRSGDYHADHGEGLDFYKVDPTRGCGGLAVLKDGKLYVSRNFTGWKILANGPIRTIFELSYQPWDAGGATVAETKRISLDLGSNLSRFESRFECEDGRDLRFAAGIITRKGQDKKTVEAGKGWMSYWQPAEEDSGVIGCGVVAQPGTTVGYETADEHLLLAAEQPCTEPFVYYAGACWDRGLDFKNAREWEQYLAAFSERLASPITIDY